MKDDTNLKALRAETDVSVMEIAQATDLHWQTVYKALDGKAGRNSTKRVKNYLSNLRGKTTKSKAG